MKRLAVGLLGFFSSFFTAHHSNSQTSRTPDENLYDQLAKLDSELFATVYTCNSSKAAGFFTEDLEFYHDNGGVTKSRASFIEELEKNFCNEANPKLRRELVKGTLKVFPMKDSAAIQTGDHLFYVTEKGQNERLSGKGKFIHLWKRDRGRWKIARVLSFDHKDVNSNAAAVTRELYDTIAHNDSLLFTAFNAHDLKKVMTGFTPDVEFYHDKDGLLNYDQVHEGFNRMFAQNNGMRRDLATGSLQVYPIHNYGAIEIGSHSFCHVENGKKECGSFPFVMIWQRRADGWKVSRVISYNH